LLTAEVEAAYPGRVTRNAAGDIISVDESPVTFAREDSESFRYGINLAGSFGTPDPNMPRRGMGMGMRGMMPPPGGPVGRVAQVGRAAVDHAWAAVPAVRAAPAGSTGAGAGTCR
jgi:hypothetical protein